MDNEILFKALKGNTTTVCVEPLDDFQKVNILITQLLSEKGSEFNELKRENTELKDRVSKLEKIVNSPDCSILKARIQNELEKFNSKYIEGFSLISENVVKVQIKLKEISVEAIEELSEFEILIHDNVSDDILFE